jgi:hypothetical protein
MVYRCMQEWHQRACKWRANQEVPGYSPDNPILLEGEVMITRPYKGVRCLLPHPLARAPHGLQVGGSLIITNYRCATRFAT